MEILNQVKQYCRIDDDLTEEDDLLQALIDSGKRYIETTTGKAYKDEDKVMRLCLVLLVAHWYTDRSNVSKSGVQEYRHTLTDLLRHIEASPAYEEAAPK